jgi:hypothetical protein
VAPTASARPIPPPKRRWLVSDGHSTGAGFVHRRRHGPASGVAIRTGVSAGLAAAPPRLSCRLAGAGGGRAPLLSQRPLRDPRLQSQTATAQLNRDPPDLLRRPVQEPRQLRGPDNSEAAPPGGLRWRGRSRSWRTARVRRSKRRCIAHLPEESRGQYRRLSSQPKDRMLALCVGMSPSSWRTKSS